MPHHNAPDSALPLVSVIINTYNHGNYLHTAVNSVLSQTYTHFEIIVIDDGSTDNSHAVVQCYPSVKYIFQDNQGISAARNRGIDLALGDYIVFLDADDWLYNDALNTNLQYLSERPEAAFVSGAHQKIDTNNGTSVTVSFNLIKDAYQQLLECNYIGMHATVMYRKWVLQKFKFDVSLHGCEDYDLYLRIARENPVIHHQKLIAAYVRHNSNTTLNYPFMLDSAIQVLNQQEHKPEPQFKKNSISKIGQQWKLYYTTEAKLGLEKLPLKKMLRRKELLSMLYRHNKPLFIKLISTKFWQALKTKIRTVLLRKPAHWTLPPVYKVNLGDLNTTQPFSTQFGYDRGGPVDRYYIEKFLTQTSSRIKGRVLEIGDNEYTIKYGLTNVTSSDILHIDDSSPKATFVGDLSNAPMLPDNSFDCIVLTQTLQLIYHYKEAIATCYRILKPGGSLLLTVPGISHIAQDQWGKYWFWSFTDASINRILSEYFLADNVVVNTQGNVLAATAFLYGMGRYELSNETLDVHDPHYQVIITASCQKPLV